MTNGNYTHTYSNSNTLKPFFLIGFRYKVICQVPAPRCPTQNLNRLGGRIPRSWFRNHRWNKSGRWFQGQIIPAMTLDFSHPILDMIPMGFFWLSNISTRNGALRNHSAYDMTIMIKLLANRCLSIRLCRKTMKTSVSSPIWRQNDSFWC